jgi:hypothetical protein
VTALHAKEIPSCITRGRGTATRPRDDRLVLPIQLTLGGVHGHEAVAVRAWWQFGFDIRLSATQQQGPDLFMEFSFGAYGL